MSNGSIMAPFASSEGSGQDPAPSAWRIFMRDLHSGFATTTHHALLVFGSFAICTLVLMFIKPELADRLQQLSPYSSEVVLSPGDEAEPAASADPATPVQATAPAQDTGTQSASSTEQKRVTQWLSRRYRVAYDATNMLVAASYSTAQDMKLDPLLILAVMAIESSLNPFAESPVGAQGLMQVMSKMHHEKFQDLGGIKAALNPIANIKVGALILKDYVTRAGSVEAGLKMYVGAAAFDSDSGYGSRVLTEYRRLKDVAAGKKVPAIASAKAAPKSLPAEPDAGAKGGLSVEADNRSSAQPRQSRLEGEQIEQFAAL